MTWHTLAINEADHLHAGFIRRYFAIVDVSMPATSWFWQQVDVNGRHVGLAHGPFGTEDDAKRHALKKLNGDKWEP